MIQARREGFALAATVMAMLVVGAVVTGGFYAAAQEGNVARSQGSADDALYIAETGINNTMTQLTAAQLKSIALNTALASGSANVTQGSTVLGNYDITISRVADALFLVRSVGTATRGGRHAGASRTLANVIRIRSAHFEHETAVMTFGDLRVGGTSDIDGTDLFPASWAGQGCSNHTGTSAVTTNPGTEIKTQGSGKITGPITREVLTSDDFLVFGDLTFADLVAMAEKTAAGTLGPEPAWSGSTCLVNVSDNWGSPDPANPCFNYFPVIHAASSIRISSSEAGQGILLVDGDLEISGGFEFFGIAIVLGEIRITGTGGHVNGTTLVYGNGELDSSSATLGNSLLQYSSCAIERAILNNSALSRAVPISHRSWLDVSAIQGGN